MTRQPVPGLDPADARHRAALAALAEHRRRLARGSAADWLAPDAAGAASPVAPPSGDHRGLRSVRLPELLLGVALCLEVYPVDLPGVGHVPTNELAVLVLVALAVLRRPLRDTSRLQVTGLLAGLVLLYLAGLSLALGLPDEQWIRRIVRMLALTFLVGAFAGRRLDLRSTLLGLLAAMAVNVPLFYAGLVPAPYQGFLTGFLGDKNVAGMYYAVIPVLAMSLTRRPGVRLALLVGAAGAVFLTGSRTALAGLLCAAVWMLLTPRMGPVLRLLLAVGLAGLVRFASENLARVGIYADREGTDWFRALIRSAAEAKTAATPWTGRGLGEAFVELDTGRWLYHDSYLALYTEGGVILTAGLLLAYAVYGLRLASGRRRTPARVAVEAAALVMLVVASQLGEVFITTPSMLVIAAGAGLALGEAETPLDENEQERLRTRVVGAAQSRWG
ncbi:hypothetical protein [Micrococcus sp.]|uniref:O-antigen ligase family protein n=1 Tax=Micrococcus sp. TaxID=1271 RepID=UPI002A9209D1|nr:hypothetical protein [Micrococcus sp.]MDY6054825.1 hypothetical protein [Micrococcus sp.]